MSLLRRGYPPAWYRDPLGAGQLRRWNGRRWTADTRGHPPWLGHVRVAVGPRRWSASHLLWAGAMVSMLGALWSLFDSPARPPVDRISSGPFVAQAEALCQATAQHFASTDAEEASRAERTRARADAWTAMVASLQKIEVDDADADVVGVWLAAWDQWIVAGRAYADALARGDDEAAAVASARSEPSKRVIDRIAVASAMPSCRFLG